MGKDDNKILIEGCPKYRIMMVFKKKTLFYIFIHFL